jgi:hypothetical protein
VTRDIEQSNIIKPTYPCPKLPTIPNHPFAFLLRKKAVDGNWKKYNFKFHLESDQAKSKNV